MGVRVLGPLEVDEGALSPRERIVLSVLVLRRGAVVSPDELADALWPAEPASTWPKQVQATVTRLRRALGAEAIRTTATGYSIELDPESIDAVRFERLIAAARSHAHEDPARAIDGYERALALWRGTPYADLASWAAGVAEADRLIEVRASAAEELAAQRLRMGEHRAVVPEAERLVRQAPLREERWVLLATALYRSGRQADALSAIRSARERLGTELGIDVGEDLEALELAILRHDPTLAPPDVQGTASATCPYRGLATYGVDDADEFFGRDADVAAALSRLARSRFLAVSGASGSGKSSLVRAGVVPALQRRGDRVSILAPEHDLDLRLRDAVHGRGRADVVVVDQFEEVFHSGRTDVDAAARAIADAMLAGTTVVLVVRSDFLDDCAAHPDLASFVAEGVHLVGPMSPDALREAIEEPARRAGLRLEPGLVELILRDAAGQAGALPHMSHALVETWLRREGATLTVAGYEASGGISGAIAQSADRLYQSMDAEQRALCRSVLMRLIGLSPEGNPVRRRVPAKPLQADAAREHVLAMLASSRLVSAEADTIAVAHESLATAWPRLHAWLEEDAESSRILAAVAAGAEAWHADGRPDDELLRGGRLQAALDWREASAPDLTAMEADYLEASAARDRSERRIEAERARRDRRQNIRLRSALAAAAALLVGTVVASAFVFVKSGEAERSALDQQIEALTSTSLALRESDPGVAALLAAELHRRWPDDSRSLSALWGSVTIGEGLVSRIRYDHGDRMVGAPIPGGRTAVVVRDAPSEGEDALTPVVSIVDIDRGTELRDLPVELPLATMWFPRQVEVSADGSVAAVQTSASRDPDDPSTCCRNLIDLIDLRSGERLVDTIELDSRTGNAFAITSDGSRVVVIHPITAELIVIDTATGGLLTPLPGPPERFEGVEGRYTTVSVGSDGSFLVGGPGGIIVHDPITFDAVDVVPLPDGMNEWVVLEAGDGSIFVSGVDAMALVGRDGEVLWRREVVQATCLSAVLPPGSGTLLCRDVTGTIIEHDLESGEPTGRSFPSLSDLTYMLELLDDDEFVTVAEREGAFLAHWRLDQAPSVTTAIADGRIVVDGFGGDGRLIITAPPDWRPEEDGGGLQVWDIEADAPVGSEANGLNWADDARVFSRHGDAAPTLVDVKTGESMELPELSGDGAAVNGMATMVSGGNGPLAFIIDEDRVIPIDPASGREAGATLVIPDVELAAFGASVAELGDGRRVAVNWFDPDEVRMLTAVFDLETGEELARGLADDGPIIATGEEHLLSASTARLTRSDAELNPLAALPTSGVAARSLQLSEGEDLLLLDDRDNRLSLYDMADARRLGTPLRMVAQDGQNFPASFLSPDGRRIVTNSAHGVLVWDIRPERLAEAACRMVGRELSALEWEAYFGDEPQVATCGAVLEDSVTAVD